MSLRNNQFLGRNVPGVGFSYSREDPADVTGESQGPSPTRRLLRRRRDVREGRNELLQFDGVFGSHVRKLYAIPDL